MVWMRDEEYGGPELVLLNRRFPVARIEHRCDGCGGSIRPGHRYKKEVGLVDGELRMQKTHLGSECYEERAWEAEAMEYQAGLAGGSDFGVGLGEIDAGGP